VAAAGIGAALVVVLSACPGGQPGCTPENCKSMVQDCLSSFDDYSLLCFTNPANVTTLDDSPYCVESCNAAPGRGELAQCIADHSAQCVAARDAGAGFDVSGVCPWTQANPQRNCDDTCKAQLATCDDACTGGTACRDCRFDGGSDCSGLCPSATTKDCADCSAKCHLAYDKCSVGCPRE